MKKDWRRVPDWGGEEHKGGGEGGLWGQPPAGGGARSSNSKHGRPPLAPGSWQQSVPAWEKRFCTVVCRIPWRKICETKRLMSYYSNVLDWDDSAGKEAFDNAKARFFAEINGHHCDISLPGPDIYIDEINWDAEVDPQLLLDLDKDLLPQDIEAKDAKIEFLSSGWDRVIPCTGWGDAEDVTTSPVRDGQAENGWANSGDNGVNDNGWDRIKDLGDGAVDSSGWGAGAQDSSGWGAGAWENSGWGAGTWKDNSGWGGGTWEDNTGWGAGGWEDNSGWEGAGGCWEGDFRWGARVWEKSLDNKGHSNSWRHQDNNNRNNQTAGYWDPRRYGRKREGDGLYGSRSPALRHQRDDFYQPGNNHWRNSRGRKRANYRNEQPAVNEQPLPPRQWNTMRPCGPRSKYGSAAAAGGA